MRRPLILVLALVGLLTTLLVIGLRHHQRQTPRLITGHWEAPPSPPIAEPYRPIVELLEAGETLQPQNHPEEARRLFRDALDLLQTAEDPPPVLRARALDGLGLVARDFGDLYLGLSLHQQALAVYRREGLWSLEADTLGRIGNTYTALGDDTRAVDALTRAIEGQPSPWRRAILRMELATHEDLQGDCQLAFDQLHDIFKQRILGADQSDADKLLGKSVVLDRLAGAAMNCRQYDVALQACRSSLQILERLGFEQLGYEREYAVARSNLGVLLAQLGRYQEAQIELQAALDALPAESFGRERAIVHFRLAQTQRSLGRWQEAIDSLYTSLSWSDRTRRRTPTTTLRSSFASRHHIFRDELIDLLLQRFTETGETAFGAEAWAVAEQGRSLDVLQRIRTPADSAAVHTTDRRLRRRLEQQIRRLEHDRLQLLAAARQTSGMPEVSTMAEIEGNQRELILQLQTLQSAASAHPQADAPLTVGDSAERRRAALDLLNTHPLDPETLVLAFSIGSRRKALWLLDSQGVSTFELAAHDDLAGLVKTVHGDIQSSDQPRTATATRQARQARQELSQLLLGPVADRLADHRLVIMADGPLYLLPFAALPHPASGEPLVQTHDVIHLPSLAALAALRERRRRMPRYPLQSATVIANPKYRATSSRRIKTPQGPSMPLPTPSPLLYSQREAEAIRHRLGDSPDGHFFLGTAARHAVLSNPERPATALLHLSVHGELDSERPEFSHLVFSLWDAEDAPVDGRLYVHELAGLDLRCDLLVLSACNTARGNIVPGEGLVGMPYAALGAGAQRALVSLWYVDDEATAALMDAFYELLLQDRLPPDRALRLAQRRVRDADHGRWQVPYYWAGFVLFGDWRWPHSADS